MVVKIMKELKLTADELAHLIELLESNAQIVSDQIESSVEDNSRVSDLLEQFRLTIQISTKLQ
ncbi:hypothetical protein [Salmonella phage S144]|uniref:Uncharacterized protein n=2 Tax=Loughboroughvirus ZCSE2 TaxID=2734117 RepID=A0A7G5CF65_9CAUD|nr:hypothetical protein [Salmonella phage S144]UOK16663.1 hypothetical protein HBKIJOIA_00062 [Salmonella phage S1]WQZ00511.1 hypothetical protein AEV23_00067 [Klebsiella phage VB_KpM-AEV23]